MRTGDCKFGASCKYHHPRQGSGGGDSVTSPISFNHMGFPLRPVCSSLSLSLSLWSIMYDHCGVLSRMNDLSDSRCLIELRRGKKNVPIT